MATQTTHLDGDDTQKPFPFMRLPAELRFYIYEIALMDTVPHLTSPTSSPTPFHGAQMLLLTSKTVRAECSKALVPFTLARVQRYKTRLSLLKIKRKSKALAVEAELVRRRRYGGSDLALTEAREAKSQMDYQVDRARAAVRAMRNAHDAVCLDARNPCRSSTTSMA